MRNTCNGCPYLRLYNIVNMAVTPVCNAQSDKPVVPHRARRSEEVDGFEVTYWRIPEHCPLDEVIKGPEKAPVKDWVTSTVLFEDTIEYTG